MENEKFQELVLGHLVTLTQEMTEVKSDVKGLKSDVENLKSLQQRTEEKIDGIQSHTAQLTEDVIVIKNEIVALVESQKSLSEMYGEHEAEIRTIRRKII